MCWPMETTYIRSSFVIYWFVALIGYSWYCKERDANGFILTGPDLTTDDELYNNKNSRPKGWNLDRQPFLLETNMPGIFAAGDVHSGSVKRVASGVGERSIAIQFVHQYLKRVW
jgi:thioredoxin reductase (NADPH)